MGLGMRERKHQGNFPVGVSRNAGLTLRVARLRGRGVKTQSQEKCETRGWASEAS